MQLATVIDTLSRLCPGGLSQNVDLATLSRWRIGGIADVMIQPSSVNELCALRSFIANEGLPSVVIGDTSNLLFSDEGLRSICIKIGERMSSVQVDGETVSAEAGVWVPCLSRLVMQAGLTGAEHTCGIPGSLGGLICMNGGSQRKGIGSAVVDVTAVDTFGTAFTLDQEECDFAYRTSVFQINSAVIVRARLRFSHAPDRAATRREMISILHERNRKFPRKQPNCGSVFKSNPAMYTSIGPPGVAIESLGLKGFRIGDAMVSTHHANFFVNTKAASAHDMVALITKVSDAVYEQTGYRMEPEVRLVTPTGSVVSP